MRRFLVSLGLVLFIAFAGWGSAGASPVGATIASAGTVSYQGSGDITSFGAWRSIMWAYSNAYAAANGKIANLVRASDGHACDFLSSAAGFISLAANCGTPAENGTSIGVWLFGTMGKVAKVYDQTGNGLDWVQATGANQMTLQLTGCPNFGVCMVGGSGLNMLTPAANVTNPTLISFAAVVERTSSFTTDGVIDSLTGRQALYFHTSPNCVMLYQNFATICVTAGDSQLHALNGIITTSGTGSILNVDGAETTVNIGNGGGGTNYEGIGVNPNNGSNQYLAGYWVEGGWAPVNWSAATRTALCKNEQARNGRSGFPAQC